MKAILSTTVLPVDGNYRVRTLVGDEREQLLNSLSGVPHYVGHPDTKAIVEALGATQAPSKLFTGLEVGEQCVCFPIKQGLSSRVAEGFTIHQAIAEVGTLDVRVITRLGTSTPTSGPNPWRDTKNDPAPSAETDPCWSMNDETIETGYVHGQYVWRWKR